MSVESSKRNRDINDLHYLFGGQFYCNLHDIEMLRFICISMEIKPVYDLDIAIRNQLYKLKS